MSNACREKASGLQHELASHAGLLLARYPKESIPKNPEAKDKVIAHAPGAVRRAAGLYRPAYERFEKSLLGLGATKVDHLEVDGRLIVGLGGENVLETGITLHHTYGVPVIPGTALKGLAAHYCDAVLGWGGDTLEHQQFRKDTKYKPADRDAKNNEQYRADLPKAIERVGEVYKVLFGATDDAGHIVFHDAWIVPDCLSKPNKGLVADVMTPHHMKYNDDGSQPPTDFDDPNPVRFLSVAGEFLVAVSCDVADETGDKWAALAMDILKKALAEWGVGGKTNAGYGRLVPKGARSAGAGGAAAPVHGPAETPAAKFRREFSAKRYGKRSHEELVSQCRRLFAGDPEGLKQMKSVIAKAFPNETDRSKGLNSFLAEETPPAP